MGENEERNGKATRNVLESWKKTSEEMDRQQLRMLADWKEMSKDAERQFSKMIEECKKPMEQLPLIINFLV